MKIVYIGQLNDACGYGNAARKYLKMFDEHKYISKNLVAIAFNAEKQNYASPEEVKLIEKYGLKSSEEMTELINSRDYICIAHYLPQIGTHPILKPLFDNSKKNFNIAYWETDQLPNLWIDILNSGVFSEVIVNSKWNQQVFSDQVNKKVNLTYLPYEKRDLQFEHGDKFTIFAMSQWVFRKGFDVLIKAYTQEFFHHKDTQLLIKTYRFETTTKEEQRERQIIIDEASAFKKSIYDWGKNSEADVFIITGHIDDQQLEKLYARSNVFCSTARSEGFGMTLADACSFGIPVIALNVTGHVDFMDKKNSFLFDGHLTPISHQSYNLNSVDMKFYEPDILSVRKQLRTCYNLWKEDKQKLLEIGRKNREYALSVLNKEKILKDFENILGIPHE